MQGGKPQGTRGEEGPQHRPITGMEPFRGQQHRAVVAGPGESAYRKHEMDVEPGKAAEGQTQVGRPCRGKVFPAAVYIVVPHPWRVADKQGRARGGARVGGEKVPGLQPEPVAEAVQARVGAKQPGAVSVGLERDKFGRRKALGGGETEPARSGARIDNAPRRSCAGGPIRHRVDDGGRGQHGAGGAALGRTAKAHEHFAQRVAAIGNPPAQGGDGGVRTGPTVVERTGQRNQRLHGGRGL